MPYFYQASGGAAVDCQVVDSGKLLAKGFEIGLVSECSDVISRSDTESAMKMSSIFASAEAWALHAGNGNDSDASAHSARLGRVLIAGRNSDGKPAIEQDTLPYRALADLAQAGELPPILRKLRASSTSPTDSVMKAAEFHQAMRNACTNRCIFVIASGQLGLGPPTMGKHDVICILYGCQWPVVLRRSGREYAIVGVSYVEDMMYGEAIKEHKLMRRESYQFCIA